LPEAATALGKLETVLVERRDAPPNLLIAQQFFVFKQPDDIARLLAGLKKAGVPELPPGTVLGTAVQMRGAEIAKLIFGHELAGRQLLPEVATYHATVAADGTVTKTVGKEAATGRMWLQGDSLCNAYPRLLTACAAVFRNPAGTPAAMNEYTQLFLFKRYEFSVTK
jgi:adenylate cyclase